MCCCSKCIFPCWEILFVAISQMPLAHSMRDVASLLYAIIIMYVYVTVGLLLVYVSAFTLSFSGSRVKFVESPNRRNLTICQVIHECKSQSYYNLVKKAFIIIILYQDTDLLIKIDYRFHVDMSSLLFWWKFRCECPPALKNYTTQPRET